MFIYHAGSQRWSVCPPVVIGTCTQTMSFELGEYEEVVANLPHGNFSGVGDETRSSWLKFVSEVDDAPKSKHPLMFYASTARVMAEVMGSAQPEDFSEGHMRTQIIEMIKPNTKPFGGDGNPEQWRAVTISPAQVSLALRVQKKAAAAFTPADASPSILPGPTVGSALTDALQRYVDVQNEERNARKKKGVLSFDLEQRLVDLGLKTIPDDSIPTEEASVKLEDAGKAAREKDRVYIGSSEGEDLQINFRPAWSRTPILDVLPGEGTLEEKMKNALMARKARTEKHRVDFLGYFAMRII